MTPYDKSPRQLAPALFRTRKQHALEIAGVVLAGMVIGALAAGFPFLPW